MTFELEGETRPTSLEGPGSTPLDPEHQNNYHPTYLTNPFYDPFGQSEPPPIPRQREGGTCHANTQTPAAVIASLEEQLIKAHTDSLTGLPKREKFIEELDQCIKEQPGNVMLLFLDLDGLKKINDTHEAKHKAGDDLLRRTGSLLRENDIVKHGCRYGGDEICIIVRGERYIAPCNDQPEDDRRAPHNIEAQNMASIIERLRGELEKDRIEVSIGGAIHMDGETAEALISRADAAMYRDKEARKKARRSRQLGSLTTSQQMAVGTISAVMRSAKIPPEDLPDLLKAIEENR